MQLVNKQNIFYCFKTLPVLCSLIQNHANFLCWLIYSKDKCKYESTISVVLKKYNMLQLQTVKSKWKIDCLRVQTFKRNALFLCEIFSFHLAPNTWLDFVMQFITSAKIKKLIIFLSNMHWCLHSSVAMF